MSFTVKGCKINGQGNPADIVVSGGVIDGAYDTVFEFDNCVVFPGFVDVHVHLREPGFSYKETVESGTKACAHGGYTTVCSMPNLNPVPDNYEHLNEQLELIKNNAVMNVVPYGSITVGQNGEELSDMKAMAPYVCAFSDDGKGVQSEDMMREAMKIAKSLGKMIVAHCEDNSLLRGGYIHDGKYAVEHGHRGICSESEWKPIERDLKLAAETGCAYHVCHISTKESVDLIRNAKAAGVDVTCETAPHYLILSDKDLQEHGRFKMNPPLRDESDRLALIEGICDGTIDMIATDHAPHSAEEKGRGLEKSAMGIVGIETAFALLYTHLVKKNIITLDKLIELMSINPSKRFGFDSSVENGNFTVFDLESKYEINPDDFLSKGRATPFEGYEVYGECLMTVCGGKIAWKKGEDNE
ncbi:MAG: dihydroorotase [Acutalibacteraceae bacterium]|nr:dihydroorotase [Acutalibacteraceae bacterium]